MKMWCMCIGVVFALSTLSQTGSAANKLYRYYDDKGRVVINDSIPPEYVKNGYDVLDGEGMLLETIPRQLTEEELRDRNSEEAKRRYLLQEQEKMRRWDESLLRRYSAVEDIEAAKVRSVRDLQIRISILRGNLNSIKQQIERQQQRAADYERRGQPVPEELASNINSLRIEIEDTEQSISLRRQEVDRVEASFDRDIARFRTLKEQVDLRRRSYQKKEPDYGFPNRP